MTIYPDTKRTSNEGKQCIKATFERRCTPKICGIITCEHAEEFESIVKHRRRIE